MLMDMAHDAEHLNGHPRPSKSAGGGLAHPGHGYSLRLSEIALLQRAARHIRLRTQDELTTIAGGTNGLPVAANESVSGSPDVDAAR